MTRAEAVNWLISIRADIGQARHSELWHYEQALADIIDLLETQSERKMGKWVQAETMNIFECSCCHSRWNVYYVCDFDYCPHCGAKMEVEQDEA